MAKQKSITEQITEMQVSNQKLNEYEKLLDKAIQIRFGIASKAFKKLIKKIEESSSDFESIICTYFDLKTDTDKKEFLSIMCTNSSRNYYICEKNKIRNRDMIITAHMMPDNHDN